MDKYVYSQKSESIQFEKLTVGTYRPVTDHGVQKLIDKIQQDRETTKNELKPQNGLLSEKYFIVQPVVDKSGPTGKFTIISGNHRFKAFQKLGETEWFCRVLPADLPDDIVHTIAQGANIYDSTISTKLGEFEKVLHVKTIADQHKKGRGVDWDAAMTFLDPNQYALEACKKIKTIADNFSSKPKSWEYLNKIFVERGDSMEFSYSNYEHAAVKSLEDDYLLILLMKVFNKQITPSSIKSTAEILRKKQDMVESISKVWKDSERSKIIGVINSGAVDTIPKDTLQQFVEIVTKEYDDSVDYESEKHNLHSFLKPLEEVKLTAEDGTPIKLGRPKAKIVLQLIILGSGLGA